MEESLLEINHLDISFHQYFNWLNERKIDIIQDLNLIVNKGEILVVFGASGSGKSLLAHAILGLLPQNALVSGSMKYKGHALNSDIIKKYRGKEISFIPQTVNSLNPLQKIKKQVRYSTENIKKEKAILYKTLDRFGLDNRVLDLYPGQLSGGMARKILVSMSLINSPEFIIADEPTPGMDDVGLTYIIEYIQSVKNKGASALIISHDIMTSLKVADRIAIFDQGRIVEIAQPECFSGDGSLFKHQYSKDLWNALPENGFNLPLHRQKGD
ncbi:ATP-binding cassette domain-containing protein [Ignavigranum ruoffiae]|uniref:ATP-binding cassette domain-containing protein n=1 Tax=Ignavigranum ruoffiae TaxID=89093 RepID=UPI0024ADF6F4|nr:ATP-binding cassette domain-containing protein [Ignavigranum ruoffiae]